MHGIAMKAADQSDLAVKMLREARKAERVRGDGSEVTGTGFTVLKYQEATISRLVASGKIGSEELRAVGEIEAVYSHLCSGLMLRGASIGERVDQSKASTPTWFVDAYHERYKPWATDWSDRKKTHNDYTLEIVYDILFSRMAGKDIDRDKGWRNGLAMQAFLGGIRDYAASAGWVSGAVAQQWTKMARQNFSLRRVSRGLSRVRSIAV